MSTTMTPKPQTALRPSRRLLLAAGFIGLAGPALAQPRGLTVYKTPYCGCCTGWVTHMRKAGFTPTIVEQENLAPIRAKFGIPDKLASCHTAMVGGYALEGHVPPADVARLLKARPKGLGLAVPGMPIGSPGMEQPGGARQRFDTLLVLDRSGRTKVFASHA
ncbi:DUF411 domain-containing protein [Caulobacter sp. RHG1]|uniref:DUF411 domain-containing protein n=1 Tax=Caulobacter sp. (strain RHG1) TaxID=2545762 RepID=UPI001F5077D1|nr:DUF411 domain-containing protein [Caulobacter sp. RHG1]